jgi:hypothetical protein
LKFVVADRRLKWILASVLLFFGIFVGSTASRLPSHIPQCVAARAVGARSSLASATRESGQAPAPTLTFLFATLLINNLFGPRLTLARRVSPAIRSIIRSSIARPALLLRPPPIVSVA